MSREQGRTASVSVFCLFYVVGVPRERSRQNEPSRHSITSDTWRANETTRALSRVQRPCTVSIARISTKTTSDPFPSLFSRVPHRHVCEDEPGTAAGGLTSLQSAVSFGRILPSLKGRFSLTDATTSRLRNNKRSQTQPCYALSFPTLCTVFV